MPGPTGGARAGRRDYQADLARIQAQRAQQAAEAAQRAQQAEAGRQAQANAAARPNQAVDPDRIAVDPATVTHISEDTFLQEASSVVGVGENDLRAFYADAAADGEFSVTDFTTGVEEAGNTLLHYGAEADPQAVESVQNTLRDLGYVEEGAFEPGVFDEGTEAAVLAFQEEHGLLVDGIVGPQTRDQLQVLADEAAPINAAYDTLESTAAAIDAGGGPFTQENLDQVLEAQVVLEEAGDVDGATFAAGLAAELITVSPNLQGAPEGGEAAEAVAIPEAPGVTAFLNVETGEAELEQINALNTQLRELGDQVAALPAGPEKDAAEAAYEVFQTGAAAAVDTALALSATVQTFNETLDSPAVPPGPAGEIARFEMIGGLLEDVAAQAPDLAAALGERVAASLGEGFGDGDVSDPDRRTAEALMQSSLGDQVGLLPVEARVGLIQTLVTRDTGDLPKDSWVAEIAGSLIGDDAGLQALNELATSLGHRDGQAIGNDSDDFPTRFTEWVGPRTLEALDTTTLEALRDGVNLTNIDTDAYARLTQTIEQRSAAPAAEEVQPPYLPGAQPAAAEPIFPTVDSIVADLGVPAEEVQPPYLPGAQPAAESAEIPAFAQPSFLADS